MAPSLDSTQLLPRLLWQNPRVHLLDDTWLLTVATLLLVLGVPWFSGHLDVQIGTAALGLLALGVLHLAFTVIAAAPPSIARWRNPTLKTLHAAGVLVLGFIWWHAGALQNPVFLLVFVLPVVGAIFLSRWFPYVTALLAVLTVSVVALAEAPDLRWYVAGFLGREGHLLDWLGGAGARTPAPFASFYAPTTYQVVMLEVFTIVLIACAVAAEYLGTIFERLIGFTLFARAEAERGQELWLRFIEQLPVPALLVDPESMRIIASSQAAASFLGSEFAHLQDRPLLEVVHFSYPDLVRELVIAEADPPPTLTGMHSASELRLLDLRVSHVHHGRKRLALITLAESSDAFFLRAALDAAEYATLVIDARGRVRAFNQPSERLFGAISPGAEAATLIAAGAPSSPWWQPGIAGRRKMHLEIAGRIYEVTSSSAGLPVEEEGLFVVFLLPVAQTQGLAASSQSAPRLEPPGTASR